MEYQLKLLKIFNTEGFSRVVDLLDELLSDEEILLNFLILNMNNTNNIKYLCNFLKKDILKYKKIINNLISNKDINYKNREIFLYNMLNKYNEININIVEKESIKICIENMKINNIYSIILFEKYNDLNDILIYKIFNENIFSVELFKTDELYYEKYINYFSSIFTKLIEEDEDLFMDWLYNICYIYNYRCKTYSKLNLQDNILYILLDIVIDKYNKLQNTNEISRKIYNSYVEFHEKTAAWNNISLKPYMKAK